MMFKIQILNYFRNFLENAGENIYLPPSAYESCFISTLHDDKMLKAAKLAQGITKRNKR